MMVRRNQSLFLNKKLGEVYESEMETHSGIG
ncbi:hypothetical protein ICE98_00084 [Lactococcus lactis]|nr:hypothetical protein [Lactococcus lactis]